MTQVAQREHQRSERLLPRDWRRVRLGEVVREAQGGFAMGKRDPSGVIQLRMNNVTTGGQFDWTTFIRIPAANGIVAKFALKPGDVVFNNTNSTELVGKTALFYGHQEPVVFSNHFTRLRTIENQLSPNFLALLLQHYWRQRLFAAICNRWVGQSAVQRDKLLSLEIPLPPLFDQQRIAALVSEQLAAVDRARIAADSQRTISDGLTAACLRASFDDRYVTRWPVIRLGDLLYVRKDVIHPHDKPSGRATFVGLEHVASHTGSRLGSVDLDLSNLTGRKPKFRTGDIVYGYLRPYLNKVWVAEFDGLCSVDQYVFSVNQNVADVKFIAQYMRSPQYLDRAPISTTPGQLPRIRTEEVATVEVSLPPLDEQRRIAAELEDRLTNVGNIRARLVEQLSSISILPTALLRHAFSGRV